MNSEELMERIIANGADESGIRDRFGTNTDLYELCFGEFLKEPNFILLERAIESKDYKNAFSSAHALKGISGNLGLTALYNTICILVESLRRGDYTAIEGEYNEVKRQLSAISEIIT